MGESLASMFSGLGDSFKGLTGGIGDMLGINSGGANNLTNALGKVDLTKLSPIEQLQAAGLQDQLSLAGQTGWDDVIKNMSGGMALYNGFQGSKNEKKKFGKEMTLYDQQIANNQYNMDKTKKDDVSLAQAFAYPTV